MKAPMRSFQVDTNSFCVHRYVLVDIGQRMDCIEVQYVTEYIKLWLYVFMYTTTPVIKKTDTVRDRDVGVRVPNEIY